MQRRAPRRRKPAEARVEQALLELLAERGVGTSVCPSEVARRLTGDRAGWRAQMPGVRAAARRLALAGRVEIRQRGRCVDPAAEWVGPIRIARAAVARGPVARN